MQIRLPLDSIVGLISEFNNRFPLVGILMILIALDWCAGFCAACITQTVSSAASYRGMMKKALMLIMVAVGAAIEPFAADMALSKAIALGFIVFELISITENCARSGIPIPDKLLRVLAVMKSDNKVSIPPPMQNTIVTNANMVEIHNEGDSVDKKIVVPK